MGAVRYRYRILGPARVHQADGTPVPLGGARLRALLAALALRAGRAVPAAVLVDDVWDGAPPADPAGALQALVARLRRALGGEAVRGADGGYRLQADADDVDLHRFERLTADGRRALADADPDKAQTLLCEALALWAGPPLADLPDRGGYAAPYEALHAEAVRLRLTADVERGQAERVLPELTALCAEHPIDEQLHGLRVRALRDCGRGADALAAYETVRAAIADRLGADPGPALRELHAQLLGGEFPRPPLPAAVRGDRPTGNLRARLTSFVGREADLEVLRGDLAASRLVTLTGTGGSGKTRLSQEAAERLTQSWPDGVWLAELAPVDDPRTVPEAVLTALGLRETALHGGGVEQALATEARQQDTLRTLAEFCGGRRLLLVLDNCEHVITACAGLVELLLVRCPGVTVLATSREPLGVPGELVRPVDPLPEPTAMRLLADRGRAARPGFDPAEDPAACAEICRRLDGLPLAIELAAARLRSMTLRQIADRLDDRFRLLTAGRRTVLPRQQTLRAAVDWSWELLEREERALLRRLAVFSGGCDLAAAEAVCSCGELDARDIAAVLGSLVDKSLVVADLAAEAPRYRMLETIAEYAAERLTEAGERAAVEGRHLAYYREYARTADPKLRGPEQVRWLDLLEREHDNLRTALRRAVDIRDEPEALQLALSCCWFWLMRNYRTELHDWPRRVAELGPDPFGDPPAPVVPLQRTPIDLPLPLPPEQLDEARRWVRTMELATLDQGFELLLDGDAAPYGRAVMDAYPPHLPQASLRPGLIRPFAVFYTGEFDRMHRLLDEVIDSCRAHGRVWELAYALQVRAKVVNDISGESLAPMEDVRESRELFARVGDRWGTAEALTAEAEAAGFRGEWQRVVQCCREAIAIARELGAHQQIPQLTVRLGEALEHCGDHEEGERLVRSAVDDALRLGPGTGIAVLYGRVSLATMLGRRGATDEAVALMDTMIAEAGPAVPGFVVGMLGGLKGWLIARAGEPEEGLRLLRGAFDHLRAHSLTQVFIPRIGVLLLPLVVMVLAALPERDGARLDRARAGAVLLGAHHSLRFAPMHPRDGEELERAGARLRARLGDDGYETAYAAGAGLSPEEAVARARDACR